MVIFRVPFSNKSTKIKFYQFERTPCGRGVREKERERGEGGKYRVSVRNAGLLSPVAKSPKDGGYPCSSISLNV